MISGFNTDIEYKGVTYHVQTEDKGLETPFILSLVYDRGTILASKRTPYTDLLEDFDEKVLGERLQKQHSIICAAINAGRIEDLKKMSQREIQKVKDVAAGEKSTAAAQTAAAIDSTGKSTEKFQEAKDRRKTEAESRAENSAGDEEKIKVSDLNGKNKSEASEKENSGKNKKSADTNADDLEGGNLSFANKEESAVPETNELTESENEIAAESRKTENLEGSEHILIEDLTRESIGIEETLEFASAEFVAIDETKLGELSETRQSAAVEGETAETAKSDAESKAKNADDDYLDYLNTIEGTLSIGIPADMDFYGGEIKLFKIFVHHKESLEKVANAYVTIKILGPNFRPLIFKAQTNQQGVADVQFHIPSFSQGRAAIIFKANRAFDEGELRRKVEPNKKPYL